MPLIVLCGGGGCGKTKVAEALVRSLKERWPVCKLINDEELSIQKTSYKVLEEEKKNRASHLGAVERALSGECLVLSDAQNGIKGLRYQLWCQARALRTSYVVVWITGGDESEFEAPNPQNRWDSPLFYLSATDPPEVVEAVSGEIAESLQGKIEKKPSQATATGSLYRTSENYLTVLEEECSKITQLLIRNKDMKLVKVDEEVGFPGPLPLSQIQNCKRQFIHLAKSHPISNDLIRQMFLDYLQKNLSVNGSSSNK